MKLSLILATVGRQQEVAEYLNSLLRQVERNFEVIVVDQNQDDRLVPLVNRGLAAGLDIKHVRLERANLSLARNTGLSVAGGDIIGFPDDDCWYDANVTMAVSRTFSEDPGLDAVLGRWVESGQTPESREGILTYETFRRFRFGYANSFLLFLKRDALVRLGGFDERLGVGQWYGAGEETDLLMRAAKSGCRIARVPVIAVHHLFARNQPAHVCTERERGTGALYAKNRLPLNVVLRGLLAPIVIPVLTWQGKESIARGQATALGRLQGFLRWLIRERS